MQKRIEKDALGNVEIPENAYYGAGTARALKNFQISGFTAPESFKKALGLVKLAAAITNGNLKLLTTSQKNAIEKACREFISGKFDDQFGLDVFQAGAGTSYNMNANEIIANRANELLKSEKGKYQFVHPNDHINMAQSTNDVIPTATRIAVLLMLPNLLNAIKNLEDQLSKKSKKYKNITKIGRTHLQDAVPITFEQEFDAYKEAISKSRAFITERAKDLQILGIGGTAIGTGLNAHPRYQSLMIKNLSKLIGIKFKAAKNLTETTHNMNSFLNFSGALRSLCVNSLNLCSDLKILGSGPKGGINEITLPAVQPGSSIMPGKVNPSMPECLEMVCLQVLGNDRVIEMAAQKSQLELNIYCPLIMNNLLLSINILTNALKTFTENCIKGLIVNTKRVKELFDQSLVTATALAPKLGYLQTAEIVKSALENGRTLGEELRKRGIK